MHKPGRKRQDAGCEQFAAASEGNLHRSPAVLVFTCSIAKTSLTSSYEQFLRRCKLGICDFGLDCCETVSCFDR